MTLSRSASPKSDARVRGQGRPLVLLLLRWNSCHLSLLQDSELRRSREALPVAEARRNAHLVLPGSRRLSHNRAGSKQRREVLNDCKMEDFAGIAKARVAFLEALQAHQVVGHLAKPWRLPRVCFARCKSHSAWQTNTRHGRCYK